MSQNGDTVKDSWEIITLNIDGIDYVAINHKDEYSFHQ